MAPRPGGLVSRLSRPPPPKFIRKSSHRKDAEILLPETISKGNVSKDVRSASVKYFGRHWKNKTVPAGNSKTKTATTRLDVKNLESSNDGIKSKRKNDSRPGNSKTTNSKDKAAGNKSSSTNPTKKQRAALSEAKRQAARRNWKRIGKQVIESIGPQTKKSNVSQVVDKGPKLLQELSKARPEITERELWLTSKIPGVPVWVAAICFVLNFVFPGIGTMLSGWSLLCCGYSQRDLKRSEIKNLICINMWIAVCQMMTVTFCLVGWFWSVFWGIKLIQKAVILARQKSIHDAELKDMTTRAFRDNMLRLVDTTRIV